MCPIITVPFVVKILVIDDNPVDRHLIGGLLGQQADMEIQFANDGAKALAMLPESTPDLIVTDLQMPVVDGLELVKAVQARLQQLAGCLNHFVRQ